MFRNFKYGQRTSAEEYSHLITVLQYNVILSDPVDFICHVFRMAILNFVFHSVSEAGDNTIFQEIHRTQVNT